MRTLANRVLSFLLGVALLVGGLTVVVDALRLATDRHTWILDANQVYADGRGALLGDGAVLAICGLMALAGVLLLALQLWPRPDRRMPVDVGEPGTTWAEASEADQRWWIARRSGEQRLGRVVLANTEVEQVNVRLRRRRHGWRALVDVTPSQKLNGADPGERVIERVQAELDALAAAGVTVSTRVHAPRRPHD